jgi:hypothetical protein
VVGAILRQPEIVLVATLRIGVPLDHDVARGIPLERIRERLEPGVGSGVEHGRAGVEQNVSLKR